MAHSKDKKEKSQKKDKVDKKEQKSEKTQKTSALAAAEKLDPTISSLFANSFGAAKPIHTEFPTQPVRSAKKRELEDEEEEGADNDEELSELDDDELDAVDADDDDEVEDDSDVEVPDVEEAQAAAQAALESNNRKRKRKDKQPELEDVYMDKLDREEKKAIAKAKEDRTSKRQKTEEKVSNDSGDSDSEEDAAEGADAMEMSPPPVHETLEPDNDSDLVKAQRTVFLGNVSAEAITSKSAKKTLMRHLESFFEDIADPEKGQPAHSVESLRFRSTAYASAIPKKAAFAKKEIMVETTKSTNAYAVYSSNALAREAARRLNGTVVLDRHLRVDEVAHPAKTEPRRCVFVGNLGFVDDESNIDKANAEEGKGTRKGNKTPSDVEEGLWRTFSTCGKVESVRVPRDPQTRVGKGFAYVQFTEENAVEAALLLNEKKFPPMLPRKLRVTRAKTIKRNVKPGSNAVKAPGATNKGIYNPKADPVMQSNMGRAGKLLGRAAAAQVQKGKPIGGTPQGFKTPESFIFEGHRAKAGSGKSGLKLGGSGKKKGKPRTRSSNRAAAWKAGGGKKKD
ncbi:RNA-binding domain-containing protein, partial [Aureobasidium melanogenum]